MFIPCERSVKEYLPAIRAGTAIKLVREHGYSQVKAASALGVTQAAVSGYLNGPSPRARNNKLVIAIEQLGGEFTRGIVAGEPRPVRLNHLCTACDLRHSGMLVCEINQKETR
jgi:predicted transcriptional regulator